MNISFVDESGLSKESKYFILGITSINEEACELLKRNLLELKLGLGIPPNVEIKWNLNDFNKQLKGNSLEAFNSENHKDVKNKVLELLTKIKQDQISILWYISPIMFFRRDAWRSYMFAFKDSFGYISQQNKLKGERTLALVDELGYLALNKEQRKKLMNDLILDINTNEEYEKVNLVIPNIDSSISFGHQFNDIVLGLMNSYLIQLHGEHHEGISLDVINAIKKLCCFKHEILIKPDLIKYRADLQLLNSTTYTNLKKDFN